MQQIKSLLRERHISQREVAEALNIDTSAVNKMLNGRRGMSAKEARALSTIVGIDLIGSPVHRDLPVIGRAAAGAWAETIEQTETYMPCPDPDIPDNAFVVVVDGDSIDKIAPHGAHVIVDPTDCDLVEGALYLLRNGVDGATIKLFRSNPARLDPCSTNPNHKPISLGRDPVEVIGRIIWKAEKLR